MRVSVGWPVKALWPNGRPHHMAKARARKAAREEGGWAGREAMGKYPTPQPGPDGKIRIHIIAHLPPRTPAPDEDNIVAASKAALDGIADALGINDRLFAAPTVEINRERTATFVICLGEQS